MPRGTSRARLEAYAIEAAAMLKADRNAAIRNRTQVATRSTRHSALIRSGATGRVIRVPDDVAFDALLAARCNQRPAGSTIQFFASGMSCGGAIALTRLGVGYEIRVNWLTGGVEIVPVAATARERGPSDARAACRGFTLIEVLVALSVVAISLAAIGSLIAMTIARRARARRCI